MISVKKVHKIYGRGETATHALKGIDIEVEAGEFVAVMGRSGSGKSTLLHILGLLDVPSSGDIVIDGKDALRMTEAQKTEFRLEKLGYVFQEYSLLPELSIWENVFLPAVCLGGEKEYKIRARELLCTVGLEDRLKHYPGQVSGGEQQRASIARALINGPKVLFADEPTASLDIVSAGIVLELFKKVNREMGQTIVMVTHESEDEKYVNRVIRLADGLVETAP